MKDQIFISYRRDGGESLAQLLHDRLTDKGYKVFYDIESLKSGPFDTKLYQKIEECEDFVLVLPPQALDRCIYDEDWVRCEIKHALKLQKNIIPILMRGFVFPQVLPDDIQAVSKMNGIEFETMGYIEAKVEKIISMLSSNIESSNDGTLDDQLNAKFRELFAEDNIDKKEDKTELRKKLERQQYLQHIQSFIPQECFLDETKNVFRIPLNNDGFTIKAPENIKFSAVAVYCDDYDFKTLSFNPRTIILRFTKTQTYENGICTNVFKLTNNNRPFNAGATSILIASFDTSKSFGYASWHKNDEKLSNAWFANPLRLEYNDSSHQKKSSACYDESTNEERTMDYNANEESQIILVDPRTGDIILRHAEYDESGKKKHKLSLIPYKKYLAFEIVVKNAKLRPMTHKEIADCYYDGISGFPKDILKAMEYYEQDGSGESLFKIANLFLENEEYKDENAGIEYMAQAAEKNNLEAIKYLAEYYWDMNKFKLTISYYKKEVELRKINAKSEGQKVDWARSCLDLGIALRKVKSYSEAETILFTALQIYKGISAEKYHQDVADVHFWLSVIYYDKDELIRPKECLLAAIDLYLLVFDKSDWVKARTSLCYNNLAYAYENLKQYSEAEAAYIEAYKIRKDLANRSPEQYKDQLRTSCEKLISFYELTEQEELKTKYVGEMEALG